MRQAPALALVLLTTLFAASMAMESEPNGEEIIRETIACLALGLLLLSSGRCASAAQRLVRTPKRGLPALGAGLARAAAAVATESVAAFVLAIPVLAVAWESGAPVSQVTRGGMALVAAATAGLVLGLLLGSSGAPAASGSVLASCLGALILWPRSLGWLEGPRRFPRPDLPMLPLAVILLFALICAGSCLLVRGRRAVTP